jgi:hypothetical protein
MDAAKSAPKPSTRGASPSGSSSTTRRSNATKRSSPTRPASPGRETAATRSRPQADKAKISAEAKSRQTAGPTPQFANAFSARPSQPATSGSPAVQKTSAPAKGPASDSPATPERSVATEARGTEPAAPAKTATDKAFEKIGEATPAADLLNAPGQLLGRGLEAVGAQQAGQFVKSTLGQVGTAVSNGVQKIGDLANRGFTKAGELLKAGTQLGFQASGNLLGGALNVPFQLAGKAAEAGGFDKTAGVLKGSGEALKSGVQNLARGTGDLVGGAFAGLGKAAGGLAQGATTLVTQPGKIAQGLYEAAKDPSKLVEGYRQTYKDHGVGGVIGHVGGDLLGGAGAARALGLGRLAKGKGASGSPATGPGARGVIDHSSPAARAKLAEKLTAETVAASNTSPASRVSGLVNRNLNRLTEAMRPYPKDLKITNMVSGYKAADPKHGVAYFNPAQQKAHQLSVRSGKIYDAQGRLFDTAQAGQRHAFNSKAGATFVVNPQGQLFAINRGGGAGGVHHSTLSAGAPVAGAGEIHVTQGVLKKFDNGSGHYRPRPEMHQQVERLFESKGIDLKGVQQKIIDQFGEVTYRTQ